MVTIADSTLRANVYEHIYDLLTAAHLASSTATVTAAFIDDDEAFPQVVLHPIDVEDDEFTFSQSDSRASVQLLIEVFTKKNKQQDQIADAIGALLKSTKVAGLSLVGMRGGVTFDTQSNSKLHVRALTITYVR